MLLSRSSTRSSGTGTCSAAHRTRSSPFGRPTGMVGLPPSLSSDADSALDLAGGHDDLHADVRIQISGVEDQVVAVGFAGIPAVELDGHVGAELVLTFLAFGGPIEVDLGRFRRAGDPLTDRR